MRKGEFVAPAVAFVHNEDGSYDDAGMFVLERFTREYAKEKEAKERTAKKGTYLPWGSGEHIVSVAVPYRACFLRADRFTLCLQCKGRFFAQHVIKMLVIISLRSLDITAVDSKTHKSLGAGFLPGTLTYLQKWKMTGDGPVKICIRKRYGDGEATADDD